MSEPKTQHQRDVIMTELLLIAMAVIWGCNFTVNKYGTQVLEPLVYTSIRMVAGTLAMLGIVAFGRGPKVTTAEKLKLCGLGLLGHGAYQLLFIYGLSRTRAGTASLVIASSPAIIALVMRTFRNERLAPRALLGIALSIIGIAVVMAGSAQESHGGASVVGDLMILGAVVCWGFYTMWLRPLTHIEGTQLAAWTLLGGTAPLMLIAAPAIMKTDFHAIVPLTWAAIAYSGLLSMGLAYLFWYRGVRVIGPTRTAMFSNLQPIVAVLVSWPMLGEHPTPWQGVGALGVMVGLWLTRQTPPAEPAHGE
jgi:drug/metabolite transporter (DMT)-like permease